MDKYQIDIEKGLDLYTVFSYLAGIMTDENAQKSACWDITLGEYHFTRYCKSITIMKADKPLEKQHDLEEIKIKRKLERKANPEEYKKNYQHNYYTQVTKEKRKKAITEKNTK